MTDFKRMYHLLYRTGTGAIFACETSPSQTLPADWGSISVPDDGMMPTGKTHRVDVTTNPHALVALTETERLEANAASNAEIASHIEQELSGTDQFMVPDRPMTDDQRAAWTEYRQTLRDLSKSDPARGRTRTVAEMVRDWPKRPDGSDPVPHLRSRI